MTKEEEVANLARQERYLATLGEIRGPAKEAFKKYHYAVMAEFDMISRKRRIYP